MKLRLELAARCAALEAREWLAPNARDASPDWRLESFQLPEQVPFDEAADGSATPPAIDMDEVAATFAYGTLLQPVEVRRGGARFNSMCSVPALGDAPADASWVVAVACVTVGY